MGAWCRAVVLSLLGLVTIAQARTAEAPARRGQVLFNQDWRFHLGDLQNGHQPNLADEDWRRLDLPHDWSVEQAFDEHLASATAYLPGGIGWYRKHFQIPADWNGRKVFIRFDGVYNNSEVWCNGHFLGRRPAGYTSFAYDLSRALKRDGGENVLAVRVDHTEYADSRWYPGSGIYRNVFLIATDPVHVALDGIFVSTPNISPERADVRVQTTVDNDTAAPAGVRIVTLVRDSAGQEVARLETEREIPAHDTAGFDQTTALRDPRRWSPETPMLYELSTRMERTGEMIDEVHTSFGVRSFRFDADRGFFLNGEGMKLKGVCLHHDAGVLGAAVPAQVWERRLKKLKEMGCNAIRASHNPPAPEFLDLCDGMGFLVMDEAFDEWTRGKRKWVNGWNRGIFTTAGYHEAFDEWAERDLAAMVRRDRNHPSIILWSIGNEIDYPNDPFPPNSPELGAIARRLIGVVKSLDESRPVTAAMAAPETCGFADLLDVAGYNYKEQLYATHHETFPQRVIYGSENSRRVEAWWAVRTNDFIAGQFLWTGIDFLGEARGWPNRGSRAGLLDLAAFPKPAYFLRQSLWTDEPMVYLHEFRGRLMAYSNCEEVELFAGDNSLGRQPVPASHTVMWRVPETTGGLKVVGKRGGRVVCSFELKVPGTPFQLTARSDRESLRADGADVAQIEIEISDEHGIRVSGADLPIQCSVTGAGRVLGLENGDQDSHVSSAAHTRHSFDGRLLLYVAASAEPGPIQVRISSPTLRAAQVDIEVR